MKNLQELPIEALQGKRVLVRLDLNVPVGDDGIVRESDADRIRKAMPTLEFLKNAGSKVIIISHIGRDPEESLKPVADYMQIPLAPLYGFDGSNLENGSVVMLENLRSDAREESNDETFARELATYGDIFVNDAFSVCHRAHASVVGIPKLLPSYAGLQLEQEILHLNTAMHPEHPAVLIMGGAKFETKLPVIQKLLPIVDHCIIGGALANNFFKERGMDVQHSLIDEAAVLGDLIHDPKIIISDKLVWQETRIVDLLVSDDIKSVIQNANTIIWNGPMGNYENSFTQGTREIAEAIAKSGATSIVGGGDSVALIEQLGLADKFTFLSTGGGAMLEYLAQGTLVGIQALEQ